jgi:hypothetical protein
VQLLTNREVLPTKSLKDKGSDAKKLSLAKSFTAALTTQFLCSEADAQRIVEETFASAHTTADDDQSKE